MNGAIVHPCPHCGQPFTLEPAYLMQYGGQNTVCTRCRQQFTLPMAGQGYAAYPQQPYGQPGVAQPGHGGAPVLGYASPLYGQPATLPVWREGKLLVTIDRTTLPHACVKCGQPGSGRPYRRTYYWHSPWIYLTILPGILIYAIVALCVRSKGTIDMALCEEHRSARRRNMGIGWVIFLSSIVLWVLAGIADDRDLSPLCVVGGILAFLAGIIVIAFSARILSPKRIENGYLWMTGAGEGFLASLPPVGGQTSGQGFPVQFRQ